MNNYQLNLTPAYSAKRHSIIHTWEGLGNIDQMRWMTRQDCLEQLEKAYKDIGLRHVRAVGLFDDNLFVVGKDPKKFNEENSKPRKNWQVIDYIFDSLLDIGISPIFTTTFMPECLASGNQTVFDTKNNVTIPKNYAEWEELVEATLNHMVHRYGKNRMRSWYYEVWNEPNLGAFYGGDMEDFFQLWKSTHKVIKKVDPNFRIGGPSTARAEWIQEFFDFTKKNNCETDYLICHIYNNDSEYAALSPFAGPQSDKINRSPNFLSGVVKGVKELANANNFNGEIHWNEWGRSWFPYDPIRESANEAAFIVKSMSEISQYADYFAYWCLSDIYNQAGYGAETFHGNYGMLNLQGLKKPSYLAHQLLNQLGTQQISIEAETNFEHTGAIATENEKELKILLYAYDNEFSPDTSNTGLIKSRILLPKKISKQNISLTRISQTENNIVTKWNEAGSPDYIKYDERPYWQELNQIKTDKEGFNCIEKDSKNYLEFDMNIPGILTVDLKY
jgi:xylan 1,4-beta-xylosidase